MNRNRRTVFSIIVALALIIALGAGIKALANTSNNMANYNTFNNMNNNPPNTGTIKEITIGPLGFGPSSLTVTAGTTVVWTNQDTVTHSVASGQFPSSGTLNPGESYSYTFNSPGSFNYSCAIHPSETGTVTVQ
jgi:plastocyanin